MKSAGKARNNGLYRHIRTSKEIIRNLLNDSINNKGKFKGLSLNRENFVDVINNATSSSFVSCSATYGEFKIELCVYFDKKGKYKKYNKYGMFQITLDAKKITWNYY